MKKKIFIALGVILALAIVGYFAYPFIQNMLNPADTKSMYQTEAARQGSLTAYIDATGQVRANQTASIAWQTSGRVANVLVAKGQLVESDAVLAELSQTSLSQGIIMAQADLISAKDALEEVMNNSEARANAQLALVQAQKEVDDLEKESRSKLFRRASQETIDIARANLINANEALDGAEEIYNQVKGRGDEDPVYAAGLSQYARARQEQTKAEYNLRYVQELPDPLDVEEVYTKVDQAKAKLLAAKEDWERIKDGPHPDDIAAAQARVDAAQATLDMAHLTAPFGGTVTKVDIKNGDLVAAGKAAFEISDLTRLLVDVEVSEVDINRIQIDQPVSLTFDGIPDVQYSGFVSDVAGSGNAAAGAVNFTVTVEIAEPDASIRPGMTAAVNIAVNQLDNVLLIPSRAVRTMNNQRIVWVLKDNVPMTVDVTLGFSSNNYTQISEGELKEGDLIILNPPANNVMMGPGSGMGGRQSP
jgi:HlyD family secretion protein